jgi:transposase
MSSDPDSQREPTREELIALVAAQAAQIAAQAVQIAAQAAQAVQIAVLEARIAELERRLGLNSSNSGKPPSSDGLKKPPRAPRTASLREPSNKPSGGQKGHKGETLKQVATPDHVIDHVPPSCAACGAAVTVAMSVGHSARQVFDLPEPAPLVVTEHRAHDCQCAGCGARSRAGFPDAVSAPVQYGPRIAAFVVYLLHYQLLPEDRLAELMDDLFGLGIAAATIARISRRCAVGLEGFVAAVRERVAAAAVKHMDETGFRVGGKTQWLHIASTAALTFYRVCHRRGSLLADVVGTVVHDHWKPYYTLSGVLHALCNAHHLRELKALVEIEKEDWAREMQRLLRRACHAANLARESDVALATLRPRLVEQLERRYDKIVAAGLAYHEAQPALAPAATGKGKGRRGRIKRRTGHNLLLRLRQRKADTLRFLHDVAVPFTNNQAERDGRMMKLKMKISGGFRSAAGAADFATIRSFISTAKKQGWNVISALTQDPKILVAALRAA